MKNQNSFQNDCRVGGRYAEIDKLTAEMKEVKDTIDILKQSYKAGRIDRDQFEAYRAVYERDYDSLREKREKLYRQAGDYRYDNL